MCFTNDIDKLNEYRAKKRAITAWKSGSIDEKTGRVITSYHSLPGKVVEDDVCWIKGQVAVPHEIRKPLGKGDSCSAGLYFCIRQKSVSLDTYGPRKKALIKARVNPKDIIAVSFDERQICCVAAKVIEAPNPDQRVMRLKWVNKAITEAREEKRERENSKRLWLEEQEQEEKEEILQQMVAEAHGLREALKGRKRANRPR